ncbi:MAG: guanitoxin biosynthesis pre-guanitoxin forming N-methyltransferase GntF [Candidatus Binatia bacterium]
MTLPSTNLAPPFSSVASAMQKTPLRKQPFVDKTYGNFDPLLYLNEYYADLGEENLELLRFYVDVFRNIPAKGVMLDFGSGPTLYSLISAVIKVKEIHIVEYLEANRLELRKWLQKDDDAFNWHPFIQAAIEMEQDKRCSELDIARREAQIRNHIVYIGRCDIRRCPPILGPQYAYEVVASNFCSECVTDNLEEWRFFVANIASLVKPGGIFLMTALKGAISYSVGPMRFPVVHIDENDLRQTLKELGFFPHSIMIRSVPADRPGRHYEGLMFTSAIKRPL